MSTPTLNDTRRSSRRTSRPLTPARVSFDDSSPATQELEPILEVVEEQPEVVEEQPDVVEEQTEIVEAAPAEPPQPPPRKKRGKKRELVLSVVEEQDEPSKTTVIEERENVPVVEEPNEQREREHEHEHDHEPRRSKRQRIGTLDWWRSERPIYRRDSSGFSWRLVGVEKGSNVDVPARHAKRPRTKTANKPTIIERVVKSNPLNLSIHASNVDDLVKQNDKRIKKVATDLQIIDVTDKSLPWKPSGISQGVTMAIIEKREGYAEGVLKLEPLAQKAKQRTAHYTTNFLVHYGVIEVEVEDRPPFILKSSKSFKLPPKTLYTMRNLRTDDAYVTFKVNKAD